ncbi:MAG: TetR/AcrR family transcriptional regulator [Planctomycetota bacterium]
MMIIIMTTEQDQSNTRHRIIAAASKRFRSSGFARTSIPRVMREVGLTHGGFYAHFASKEELFSAAVAHAAIESGDWLEAEVEGLESRAWVERWVDIYVSNGHCRNCETGCPIPLLMPEVAREGEAPCAAFEAAFQRRLARVREHLDLPAPEAERRFRLAYAHMAGAVMLARVLGIDESEDLRKDVAASVKDMLLSAYVPNPEPTECDGDYT